MSGNGRWNGVYNIYLLSYNNWENQKSMVKHLQGFLQIMNLFHPPSNKRNFGTNFLTNLLWEKMAKTDLMVWISRRSTLCVKPIFTSGLMKFSMYTLLHFLRIWWAVSEQLLLSIVNFGEKKKRIIKNNYFVLFFSRIKAFKFIMFLKDPPQKD